MDPNGTSAEPAVTLRETLAAVETALLIPDYERAVALARNALDKGCVHPLFLNLRAFWFEGQQRNQEALSDLLRARELAPADVLVLNALGLCLARCDRTEEAVEAFTAASVLQPDFVPAHFNRAWSAERLGNLAMAEADYKEALRLQPQHPDAMAGLAFISTRLGDWKTARSYGAQALAWNASQPTARLALASADIEEGHFLEADARLNGLLDDAVAPQEARAMARGLLADSLDRQGRFTEAFSTYRTANAELSAIYAPRFGRSDVMSAHAYVLGLTDYFRRASAADWTPVARQASPAPDGPQKHIFIVGFPRSGTTLLEQAIGNHPAAVTTEETEALVDSMESFMERPGDLDVLARSSGQTLEPFRGAYWRRLNKAGFDVAGRILIDKLPLNTIKLPLIAKLFPAAKIIFAVRDPRDVVLSCFRRRFRMNASMYEFLSLEGAARYYAAVMTFAEVCREKLPLAIHLVRHEDVLSDFEGVTREVCQFAGIDWNEDMHKFADRAKSRAVATPSTAQLARGLDRRGVEHWRHYASEMTPVMPLLDPWVRKFGYADV